MDDVSSIIVGYLEAEFPKDRVRVHEYQDFRIWVMTMLRLQGYLFRKWTDQASFQFSRNAILSVPQVWMDLIVAEANANGWHACSTASAGSYNAYMFTIGHGVCCNWCDWKKK